MTVAANTPPLPHNEGDTFTNAETGIKYQFIGGAWRAVSSKAAEDIADAIGTIDLERVLDNGNVSDQSIVLINGTDDALLLSPEDARIMVGGVGENVVPRFELRHETGILDTSIVKLELDEDGERFDVECDEKVNNIHFRFNDDVKLELNKTGDAVFNGKVKVARAIDGDEVPTFDQVSEATGLLQLQIDQIANTFERGSWNYDDGDGIAQGTEYVLSGTQTQESYDAAKAPIDKELLECQGAAQNSSDLSACNRNYDAAVSALPKVGDPIKTNDWKFADKVTFSPTDLNGNVHSFTDVKVGQTLDMVCEDGSGAMVAEITGITLGMWYEEKQLDITPIKTSGVANGKTRVKIFTLDDTVDTDALDAYVKKIGENKVESGWKITSQNKTHFHVEGDQTRIYWLQDPSDDQHPVTRGWANSNYIKTTGNIYLDQKLETRKHIWIRPENANGEIKGGAGIGNMLIVNQESGNQGSIVRIQQGGEDCLKVEVNRRVNMFHNIVKDLGDPRLNSDGAKDAANRDYVDKKRLWKWTGDQTTSPKAGEFSMASSGAGYLYFNPVPVFGTRLKCSGNKYLCKGGDSLDGDKEFGFAMYTIWAWEGDHWEPAISGHISATGIRTGKNDEPWRFSSNKNTVIVLEGLKEDKLYNITVAGTILS